MKGEEMEEIIKKIKEKVEEIILKRKTIDKMDEELLNYQKDILKKNEEAKQIKEKESGFYKDIVREIEGNKKIHKKLFEEREKKRNKLKKEIDKTKLEIVNELKEKQKIIDENRNKKIEDVDIDKLKKEKEKIKEELALNDVAKEEFLKMNFEEQLKVKNAKERYLINKKRLEKIEPIIDLFDLLSGKDPKEKFIEIGEVLNQVREKFNIDQIEELKDLGAEEEKIEEEEIKNDEKTIDKPKVLEKKVEPVQLQNEIKESKVKPVQLQNEIKEPKVWLENLNKNNDRRNIFVKNDNSVEEPSKKLTKISINENEGVVIWTSADGKQGKYSLNAIKIEKNAMFKRLDILSACKNNSNNLLNAIALYMKVNPAIIKAMENDRDGIINYLKCLNDKNDFSFELVHDLTGLSIFQKLTNRFVGIEEKLGAIIKGKVFNKNKALMEPQKENKNERIEIYSKAHKDFEKTLKLIKNDRDTIKTADELKRSLSKEVIEMMTSNEYKANKYSELVNRDYMKTLERQNLEESDKEDYR